MSFIWKDAADLVSNHDSAWSPPLPEPLPEGDYILAVGAGPLSVEAAMAKNNPMAGFGYFHLTIQRK